MMEPVYRPEATLKPPIKELTQKELKVPERKAVIGSKEADVVRDVEHSGADYFGVKTGKNLEAALLLGEEASTIIYPDTEPTHPLTAAELADTKRKEAQAVFDREFNAAFPSLEELTQEVARLKELGIEPNPVFYVHGIGRDGSEGKALMELCKKTGVRCFAINLRDGYMLKDGEHSYDFEGLAVDVKMEIDRLRREGLIGPNERVTGVGQSLGGLVLANALNMYKDEKIFSNVVFTSSPFKDESQEVNPTVATLTDTILQVNPVRSILQRATRALAHLKLPEGKKHLQGLYDKLRRVVQNENIQFFGNNDLRSLFACYKRLFGVAWNKLLSGIDVPIVATWGRSDDMLHNKVGIGGIEAAPKESTTQVHIPNRGHKLPEAEMLFRIVLTEQLRMMQPGLHVAHGPANVSFSSS